MRKDETTDMAPVRAKLPHSNLKEEQAAVPKESPQIDVHTNAFLLILSKQHLFKGKEKQEHKGTGKKELKKSENCFKQDTRCRHAL
jgi:hypothetical protein